MQISRNSFDCKPYYLIDTVIFSLVLYFLRLFREYKNHFEKMVSLQSNINYHRPKVKKNSYIEKLHYTPCEQSY